MAKPILNLKDKRLTKIYSTHGALCYREIAGKREFKFFNVDNLPETWKLLGVARLATSGLTISEAIYSYNKELKNVRIKSRKKPVRE